MANLMSKIDIPLANGPGCGKLQPLQPFLPTARVERCRARHPPRRNSHQPVVPEMRVRSFFIACMSVAAVIALIVAGKLVLMSWSAYTAQAAASEAVGMAAKLMKISEGLANERGPYSVAVAADQPAGDKDRELFRGLRADTDRALAAAGEAAKQAALVGAHGYVGTLAKVATELKAARDQADAEVAKPKKDRDLGIILVLAKSFQALYAPIYEKVVAAGRGDGKYPFDIPEYRRLHVPGLNSLLLVRDGAFQAADELIAGQRAAALSELTVALGALLLIAIAIAGVVIVFTRRIVTPLV